MDKALSEDRNLDYFCFFCRCIWSQSSVHCMTCMKCVEGFDHHCSIINNCIGYKNHGNFLTFLFFTFCYSISLIGVNIEAFKRRLTFCEHMHRRVDKDPTIETPFLCHDQMGHSIFGVMLVGLLALTILQSLPAIYQILV